MPDYQVNSGTWPTDYCPPDWATAATTLAGIFTVNVPENTGVVIQAGTPSVSDQDKLWIKTDTNEPYTIGAYAYVSGNWRRVPGLPVYYSDTSGFTNSIIVTTGDSISSTASVAGRIFIIKVANAVTGATTITLDSLTATALKKAKDEDIEAGDIKANQLILVAYNTTTSNWELITTFPSPVESATKETKSELTIPTSAGYSNGTPTTVALSEVNSYTIKFYVRDTGPDVGWQAGDEIDFTSMLLDMGTSKQLFQFYQKDTAFRLIRPAGVVRVQTANKSTGAIEEVDTSKWYWKVTAKV